MSSHFTIKNLIYKSIQKIIIINNTLILIFCKTNNEPNYYSKMKKSDNVFETEKSSE